MEFLLKKDGSNKTTISDIELAKLFDIANINKKIKQLETKLAKLEEIPTIDKKYILSLIDSEILKKGEVFNISHASSIEKLKSIPVGSIYYNSTNGIRLKTDGGWVTLKTE